MGIREQSSNWERVLGGASTPRVRLQIQLWRLSLIIVGCKLILLSLCSQNCSSSFSLTIKYLKITPRAPAPFWATSEVPGLDSYSIPDHTLTKGLVCAISTGIGIKMPPGHFGITNECSSLVLKGICVCRGIIGPDYQGEIQLILQNEGKDDIFINKHDWIVQLWIISCVIFKIQKGEPPNLLTVRGDKGFRTTNEIYTAEGKIWVKHTSSPTVPADVIAQGKENTILMMPLRQEKWKHMPLTHCYSCE